MSWPCKRPTHPYERATSTHCRQNSEVSCQLRRKSANNLSASRICRYDVYRTVKRTLSTSLSAAAPLRLPENHLISCSNVSNSLPEKNSFSVMPKPSHNFLIVTMPGFLLFSIQDAFNSRCGHTGYIGEVIHRPSSLSAQ